MITGHWAEWSVEVAVCVVLWAVGSALAYRFAFGGRQEVSSLGPVDLWVLALILWPVLLPAGLLAPMCKKIAGLK